MNAKQQRKLQRRADKLSDEARAAHADGDAERALKLLRRATTNVPDGPELWRDLGLLLLEQNADDEAATAFETAIGLDSTDATPLVRLAAIRARQGRLPEAVALQATAAALAPDEPEFGEQLRAYKSLAGPELLPLAEVYEEPTEEPAIVEQRVLDDLRSAWPEILERLAEVDRPALIDTLTRNGGTLIPRLLPPALCERLRRMFDDEERFDKTVTMNKPQFGQGVYRYFRAPLPPEIDGLRRAVYPLAAAVANAWRELLREDDRFPETWEGFRRICARAGQTSPTPLLLRYEAGGFNALHRDLRGDVFFPVQLAIVLNPRRESPSDEGFEGGEFVLCDMPERKKSDRRRIPAGLGDAILFCTRDRLMPISGLYGLKPVAHGVEPILNGTRYVLGLPFHEYT